MKGYLLCFLAFLMFCGGTSAQKKAQKLTRQQKQMLFDKQMRSSDSLLVIAQKEAYNNNFAGAKEIMLKILPQNDTVADYSVFYGALMSWMGKYDTAKTILRSVIARHPKNLEAYDALTDVELWSKEDSMVIVDCNKALLIPKAPVETYELKIAEAQTNLKKFLPAYAIVKPYLAKDPNDSAAKVMNDEITAGVMQKTADSLFDSAQRNSYRAQFVPAEKVAKQLTLEYPDNSDYMVLWCRLLGYRRKADTSEIMLRQVLNREPQNLDAIDAFADDELVTERFLHSEQLCDSGLSMPVKGDKSDLVVTKASAEDNMEEYYKGLKTLDTLVKKHPDNEDAKLIYNFLKTHYKAWLLHHREDSLYEIAQNMAERKHYDSALVSIDTVIKWDSTENRGRDNKYLVYKAILFDFKKQYDTAISIVTAIIKKNPREMDAYDVLGDAELGKKEFALVVKDCDRALRDSIFVGYPSMISKSDSTARDSTKHDTSGSGGKTSVVPVARQDTLKKDTTVRSIDKDSLKAAQDSDAKKYYTIFMLKRAQSLFYMETFAGYQGCVNTIDTLRKRDSTNEEANNLLVEAKIKLLKNAVQLGYLGNYFNQAPFGPWHFISLQYMRNLEWCPVYAQATYGSIYGLPAPTLHSTGWQYEVGAYPKFSLNTYADVSVAYSNSYACFPQWVVVADVFQKLPFNLELSIGGMYMHFIDVVDSPATAPQDIWIFDPSLAWNYGDHFELMYHPYFAYRKPSVFVTHEITAKYIFKNPDWFVSLFGVIGTEPFVDWYYPSPQATITRQIGTNYQMRLPHNFLISAMVSYEYIEYYPPANLWGNMYYFQVMLTKRF